MWAKGTCAGSGKGWKDFATWEGPVIGTVQAKLRSWKDKANGEKHGLKMLIIFNKANEHFSVVYTALQLSLKDHQPSPQPTPARQADIEAKASARRSISSKVPPPSLSTSPPRIVGISSASTAMSNANAKAKKNRTPFQASYILIDVWKT
jgi:hypothetical protein